MLRTLIATALLVGLVHVAAAGFVQAPPVTSEGKQSAYGHTYVVDLEPPGAPANIVVTIQRGKGKRVLLVDASMVSNEFGPVAISVGAVVNGVELNPPAAADGNCSVGEFGCTTSAHWWLDLDQAEAENPGQFIGKPLVIQVFANEENGIGAANVSVRAWMQKK